MTELPERGPRLSISLAIASLTATAGLAISTFSACTAGDPRIGVAASIDSGAADGSSQAEAGACRDDVSLCKAHGIVCGTLAIFDVACSNTRVVACGTCPGAPLEAMRRMGGDTFKMGNASPTAPPDETPPHDEAVGEFFIDAHEVSVAEYAVCVAEKICTPAGVGGACNAGRRERSTHPVNCIDWYQANVFCSHRGHRLPTEAEWEYAARGGRSLRAYPWGNQSPSSLRPDSGVSPCWSGSDAGALPSTCDTERQPNLDLTAQLVFDLGANVREWTLDGWSPTYATSRETTYRVARGGGWFADFTSASVNAVHRLAILPTTASADLGFRCVTPFAPVRRDAGSGDAAAADAGDAGDAGDGGDSGR